MNQDTFTIAVAGKGGTGKSTIAGIIIGQLASRPGAAVLAIDADPSSNLHRVLGISLTDTLGEIREEMRFGAGTSIGDTALPRRDYLDLRINQAIVESTGFDLVAMGRPEGPGCYCAANTLLRDAVAHLSANYAHVVIDNEAGLEHLSRQTTTSVDLLLVVTDPTVRGVEAAERVIQLAREMGTTYREAGLIVNKVERPLSSAVRTALDRIGIPVVAEIGRDDEVERFDADGKPLVELPESSVVVRAIARLLRDTGLVA